MERTLPNKVFLVSLFEDAAYLNLPSFELVSLMYPLRRALNWTVCQ